MLDTQRDMHPALYGEDFQLARTMFQAIADWDETRAQSLAQAVSQALAREGAESRRVQLAFFLQAALNRLRDERPEITNLYLLPDEGQQIKMFNLMAQKFPLVRVAQDVVNTACMEAIRLERKALFLDIGMGTGQQVLDILNRLSQAECALTSFTIVGIEPAADSLTKAEEAIRSAEGKLPFEVRLVRFQKAIEALDDTDWAQLTGLLEAHPGKILVNASFALHHIRPVERRAELFERLHAYRPALVTLIEPYADFVDTDLMTRFHHAWLHYGLTFHAIDQIDATEAEKTAIKQIFFRREITDVLSEESQRVERFETGEMWRGRLEKAGFKPFYPEYVPDLQRLCPFVGLAKDQGYLGLTVEGDPIISILCACP